MLRIFNKKFLPAVLCGVAVFFAVAAAAVAKVEGLRGEVFSDPAWKQKMPEEWIKQPVQHPKEAGKADLFIVMDQDIYHTLLPLIQKFGKEHNIKIVVKEGTCGIAAGLLAAKGVDMGGFCCAPGKEDRLPGLKFHTMGIVSKAFLINPENPVDNLSTAQLREIYRGKIFKWSEIKIPPAKKGPDLAIKTIGRLHCPKRPGHWRQLLDNEKMFSPRLNEVGSIPDMIAQVAASRDAIGWEVMTMVEKYKGMGKVKALKIDGYSPTDSTALATLRYPFYRTYTLSTWEGKGIENQHAQELVEYMKKEFDKLDADKFGFVSVRRLKEAGWKFRGDELVGEPK